MMIRSSILVLEFFFFISFSSLGQASFTPDAWISKIEEAESPEKNSSEVIGELERLTDSYLQTVGKDSIYARMVSRLGDRYRSGEHVVAVRLLCY